MIVLGGVLGGVFGGAASLGLAGAAATLPGTLELGVLTLGAALPARKPSSASASRGAPAVGRLAVIVPAHNESSGISACVQSLLACEAPEGAPPAHILVVADNCSDDTAERARAVGAEVLERDDNTRLGKGYALELAFEHALSDPSVGAVLVVDADTQVRPNFLVAMGRAFERGADGVQCRYLVSNADEHRLRNVALLAFNVGRPRARERFGLSVGILGNGFGLRRHVLERLPYTAQSVVEDLEYHLMMVREGFAVRFVDDTAVSADVPTTDAAEKTQRARWEGGRLRMVREHLPTLLGDVARLRLRSLEPLGELLLLPLASHVGILLVVLVLPFPPTQLYAAGALGLVAAHVATSLIAAGGTRADALALAKAPLYVVKKLSLLPAILRASKKDQEWVRTARAT